MTRPIPIPIVGGAYEAQGKAISPERLVNWYMGDGPNGPALLPTPGLTLAVDLGSGPVLATHFFNDLLYVVAGGRALTVNSSYGVTDLGSVIAAPTLRPVIKDNGTDLMILTGTLNGYSIVGGVLSPISDVDFSGGTTLTFQDGYFILTELDGRYFRLFDLYTATSTLATDFATVEGQPDKTLACISDHHELWLLGEYTCEVWFNSGDPDFPFERMQAGFGERGIAAPHTLAKFDNSLTWLSADTRGHGLVVQAGNGYQPQVISTPAINYRISRLSSISDAFAFVYQLEGHEFYVLTFPTGNLTLCYDASTKLWNDWSSNLEDNPASRHRANCHAFAWGRHMVGDCESGKLYVVDPEAVTEAGATIIRDRITQNVTDKDQEFSIGSVQVKFQTGVGTNSGQGVNPTAMLRWSKDEGNTWSNELHRPIGRLGQFRDRARWNKCGSARNWTFWLRVSDPVKWIVTGAMAEVR